MDIVRGSSNEVAFTAYKVWAKDVDSRQVADITGSTIKMFIKARATDPDSAAILTLNGVVVDGVNGKGKVVITAANTNNLSYQSLVYEIVTKLADGITYIRNGVQDLNINMNVGKVLF